MMQLWSQLLGKGGTESGTGPTGFYAETMISQQTVILGSAIDRTCIIENKCLINLTVVSVVTSTETCLCLPAIPSMGVSK